MCDGGKHRREFHYAYAATLFSMCVDKGFVWHCGTSNRCQAGDETFRHRRASSSGMLQEKEDGAGRRQMDSWQEHIVKRWKWQEPTLDSLRIVFNQHKAKACRNEGLSKQGFFLNMVSVKSNASPTNQTIIWDKGHLLPLRTVCRRFSRTSRVITKRMACWL